MRVLRTLHTEGTYPYHIHSIQHLEPVDMCSQLEMCRWINSNAHMIRNILFTGKAHFTNNGVNNTRNFQHCFSINVCCGVSGDKLIGLYIFPQRLTGDIYANFLQDELPALLENVPLQTR